VRNTATRNALQMYDLEERIQGYKNKWHNDILRMDSSKTDPKLRITNKTDEEMLDNQEYDARVVRETERSNESLPLS
jgi:hypothetical protein